MTAAMAPRIREASPDSKVRVMVTSSSSWSCSARGVPCLAAAAFSRIRCQAKLPGHTNPSGCMRGMPSRIPRWTMGPYRVLRRAARPATATKVSRSAPDQLRTSSSVCSSSCSTGCNRSSEIPGNCERKKCWGSWTAGRMCVATKEVALSCSTKAASPSSRRT